MPGDRPPAAPAALEAAFARVDDLADRRFAEWKAPGLVYGILVNGRLIHTRGLGTLRVGDVAPPTPASVFRIASMTKSFTAATVLLLRDEGRLRLDDPIAEYVPELAGLRYATTDAPPITIRHLLTMTAGLPTDDPWGDRQQGLDLAEFSKLLAGGLSFVWAPGTRFEYSNTGYGILGRLITNVAGAEYREVVRERLLRPLGMDSSGYLESEVAVDRLARGYVWRDGAFLEEPIDGYGALASMGGLFTTVEDLARWVAGFLDADPPRDGPEGDHPLSRATRREMQLPAVSADPLRMSQASADAMPDVESSSYGFGLFLLDDLRLGRIVAHGGGYPGFGSSMCWHPGSGLGVIALTNTRYGPAGRLAREQLVALLQAEALPLRRTRASAATEAARAAVEALLRDWDDGAAAALFAMNVELDEPVASRRAAIEALRSRHGMLRADQDEPMESRTSFRLAWWLAGDRGRVRAEILLSPELPPKVQSLTLTSVPEPPAELRAAAERIVEVLREISAGGSADLAAVPLGESVDRAACLRALRAAEAQFQPTGLGKPVAGDGETIATYRLAGDRDALDLVMTWDPVEGVLTAVSLVPVRLTPPNLD
jgi:CubicO group peptidase (beta-lactamase class C family)